MQLLAILKGLGQGYIVTAPAMLIMRLVGKKALWERSLPSAVSSPPSSSI